jgi:hypothetical protein
MHSLCTSELLEIFAIYRIGFGYFCHLKLDRFHKCFDSKGFHCGKVNLVGLRDYPTLMSGQISLNRLSSKLFDIDVVLAYQLPKGPPLFLRRLRCLRDIPPARNKKILDISHLELRDHSRLHFLE